LRAVIRALSPLIFLIVALVVNVQLYGDRSLEGSNQLILLASAGIAALLTPKNRKKLLWKGIETTISDSTKAILILLMVGALAGAWMVSGIIPTLIVYGLKILSPKTFLVSAAVLCCLVSLATGSSWSTSATIGIALMGIGQSLGIPAGWIAGAVVSGAYFGDKMSPVSDTTNIAATMAGAELTDHIRHMIWTSGPAILIAFLVFGIKGLSATDAGDLSQIAQITELLNAKFTISPWLILVPLASIALIVLKVDALAAMGIGTLAGVLAANLVQPQIIAEIAGHNGPSAWYEGSMQAVWQQPNFHRPSCTLGATQRQRNVGHAGHRLVDSLRPDLWRNNGRCWLFKYPDAGSSALCTRHCRPNWSDPCLLRNSQLDRLGPILGHCCSRKDVQKGLRRSRT